MSVWATGVLWLFVLEMCWMRGRRCYTTELCLAITHGYAQIISPFSSSFEILWSISWPTNVFHVRLPAGHAGERFHIFNLSSFGREERMVKAEFRWFRKKQKFFLGKSYGPHFYKVKYILDGISSCITFEYLTYFWERMVYNSDQIRTRITLF